MNEQTKRTNGANDRTTWLLFCYRTELPTPGKCYEQFPVTIPSSLESYADMILSRQAEWYTSYIKTNNRASDICHTANDCPVNDLRKFWDELLNNTIDGYND